MTTSRAWMYIREMGNSIVAYWFDREMILRGLNAWRKAPSVPFNEQTVSSPERLDPERRGPQGCLGVASRTVSRFRESWVPLVWGCSRSKRFEIRRAATWRICRVSRCHQYCNVRSSRYAISTACRNYRIWSANGHPRKVYRIAKRGARNGRTVVKRTYRHMGNRCHVVARAD